MSHVYITYIKAHSLVQNKQLLQASYDIQSTPTNNNT